MAEYLHNNGCDVVVSLVTSFKSLREEFKTKMGEDIVELYTTYYGKRERYKYKHYRLQWKSNL